MNFGFVQQIYFTLYLVKMQQEQPQPQPQLEPLENEKKEMDEVIEGADLNAPTVVSVPLSIDEEISEAIKKLSLPPQEDWTILHNVSFGKDLSRYLPYLVKEKGLDINQKNERGETPLHIAILKENFETIQTLLDLGASLQLNTNQGNSPLYIACERGNLQIVKELITRGADMHGHKYQQHYQTPLMIAVIRNHIHIVKYLLDNGCEDLEYGDKNYCTPLFIASQNGLIEMMETLIQYGANVDARNTNDSSPIFGAVGKNQMEAVKTLLKHKADINLTNNRYYNALFIAVNFAYFEMIEFLIDAGIDMECRDGSNYTPLMSASYANHVKIVKILVEKGANPNASNSLGYSSLILAIQKKNLNVVDLLLESPKLDINKLTETITLFGQTNKRFSPLYFAVHYNLPEIVSKFLKLGANPNLGLSPLLLAFKNNRMEMVEELLNHGAEETTEINLLLNLPQFNGPIIKSLLQNGYGVWDLVYNYFPIPCSENLHKLMYKKKGAFKGLVPELVTNGFFEELDCLSDHKKRQFVRSFLSTLNYKVPKIKRLFKSTDIVHACRSLHALALICEHSEKKLDEKKKLLNDAEYLNLLFPFMAIPESYRLACRTLHLITKDLFSATIGFPTPNTVFVNEETLLLQEEPKTVNIPLRNSKNGLILEKGSEEISTVEEKSTVDEGEKIEKPSFLDFRKENEADTVTFRFENDRYILCDKSTLMSQSVVFSRMLGGVMKEGLEKDVKIEEEEYTFEIFQKLIEFLYKSDLVIHDLNEMEIWHLISLAHRYDVSKLIDVCIDQLQAILSIADLDMENILSCVKLSQTYQVEKMEKWCYNWLCVYLDQFSGTKYAKFILLGGNKDGIDENIIPDSNVLTSLQDFVLMRYINTRIKDI
eukprot:TRINITY_DN3095_c0_g1_i1.p1 TRINITY_DN3095_c0_g1~~TRINITY_DN3095_c0_g1_i1.p1  ORF type:complete len:883 (+),score=188.59 TRINITY_DN3095_c0_g1_i1:158-2806(+)